MTLPYTVLSFERALTGIRSAVYQNVTLTVSHRDSAGTSVRLIGPDPNAVAARQFVARLRDTVHERMMMFANAQLESQDPLSDIAACWRDIRSFGTA